jgi:hypothetical protein
MRALTAVSWVRTRCEILSGVAGVRLVEVAAAVVIVGLLKA